MKINLIDVNLENSKTMKNTFSTLIVSTVATLAASSFSSANALTLTTPPCTNSTIAVSGGTGSYLGCSGAWEGNDSNQTADVLAQLVTDNPTTVLANWSYNSADKSDSSGNGVFTSNPTFTSGTLTFDTAQTGLFAIAIKASNQFSLFSFNGTGFGISSIDFTTNGVSVNNQGRPQNLSHASFYRGPDSFQPAPGVPEPLTILGTGLALGFGGFFKKKYDQKKSLS